MQTQKVEVKTNDRIESGSVQFVYENGNQDWPGFFLRGDNAFALMLAVEKLKPYLDEIAKEHPGMILSVAPILSLVDDIKYDVIVGGKK